jgi:hypothetical protein
MRSIFALGWTNRIVRCGFLQVAVAMQALVLYGEGFAPDSDLRTVGDPTVRAVVDTQVKKIYDLTAGPGVQVELITRDNPLHLKNALSTELTGSIIDGFVVRIVGTVWTSQGRYSVEFYRDTDKLLMVYETFSYFEKSAPPDTWHNFMGLPAWESRIYFDGQGHLGYAETRGPQAPSPEISAKQFPQQAQRVAELLGRSPARWERR